MHKIVGETKSEAPPWEARRSGGARAVFRRLASWVLGLGLIAGIAYGLRPRPIDVELATVGRGALTVHVVEEGRTRIRNRYVVSAPVGGNMRRVQLKNGAEVKAGETVLTTIEPALSPLLDPRAKAQAEARVQATDAARMKAVQSLDMARTALQFAQTNWTRVRKLSGTGSVSDADRDNAERDAEMRVREVRAAEFELKVAEFECEQARAALLQLESPGTGAAVELRSPVSGRLLRVMQESAMVVVPGTQILELGDPADIEIEAEILSRDAVAIKPGAPVTVEQWGGEKPLQARVRLVEPAAFMKVSALGVEEQRVIVLCDLIQPPPEVSRLGDRYRVEVRVAVWHGDDVLLVPAGALFREGSDWKTFVYEEGVARKRTIEAGRSDGRMTEVRRGLEAGVRVLLHPPDTVRDGVKVRQREGA